MILACPQCREVICEDEYDSDVMFKKLVFHAWRVHNVRTKKELYALSNMSEEE